LQKNSLTSDLKAEEETNEMMIDNGDGVCMFNYGFCPPNQIQNTATDTPKLCTSVSRIDTRECLQKYLIDQRLV